jgi:hypothetical protein
MTLGPPWRPGSALLRSGAGIAAPSLRDVLRLAGDYVVAYDRDLGSVIADEDYQQDVDRVSISSGADPDARLRPDPATPVLHRMLRSEFVLVRPTGITEFYRGFRDVIEVDGRAAPDRANIHARFTQGGDLGPAEVRRLIDASARYNIGALTRNVNVPTFALLVVHPSVSERFAFEKLDERRVRGVPVWTVAFRERQRPTLVRDVNGSDMPASGTLGIDPESGRILRTEFTTEKAATHVRARITVDYEPDAKLGVWVPREMTEDYHAGKPNSVDEQTIHCVAKYSNYRRFEVTVRIRP